MKNIINKNYIDEMVDELWDKFKSPLGHSSIDNKFNSMFDLENFLKQKLHEVEQHEKERIIEIIKNNTEDFSLTNITYFSINIINKINELK